MFDENSAVTIDGLNNVWCPFFSSSIAKSWTCSVFIRRSMLELLLDKLLIGFLEKILFPVKGCVITCEIISQLSSIEQEQWKPNLHFFHED